MTPRLLPGQSPSHVPEGCGSPNVEEPRGRFRQAKIRARYPSAVHESGQGERRHRALESRGGVHSAPGAVSPKVRTVAAVGRPIEESADNAQAEIQRLGEIVRELQRKLVTVCAWSRKIEYEGEWVTFEEFLYRSLDIPSSHGMSPPVFEEIMAQMRADSSDDELAR